MAVRQPASSSRLNYRGRSPLGTIGIGRGRWTVAAGIQRVRSWTTSASTRPGQCALRGDQTETIERYQRRTHTIRPHHLRASKDGLTAVQTSVSAGREQPSGAKLGVLTGPSLPATHARSSGKRPLRPTL